MHHSALNPLHWNTQHGIHWIQSGSIGPHCMGSTAFNQVPLGHVAWNPQHSIGIHCTMLHGIYPIQDGYICQNSWNPLHSLEMHFTSLHRIQCIQSCCIESTAFNRDFCPTPHAIHCIHSGCISHCCMESSAFNHTVWNPLHSIVINYTKLNGISFI